MFLRPLSDLLDEGVKMFLLLLLDSLSLALLLFRDGGIGRRGSERGRPNDEE